MKAGNAAGAKGSGYAIIQAIEEDANRRVQLGQGEELLIAQTCCNPAFRNLDGNLDRRLVAGLPWPGGHPAVP
jgi:hypothetical protein